MNQWVVFLFSNIIYFNVQIYHCLSLLLHYFHYFAFGSSSLGLFAKCSTCTRFTKFDLRSRSFSLSVRVPFALSSDFAFGSSSLGLFAKCSTCTRFTKFDLRSRSFSLSVRVPFALSSDFAFGSSSLSALHEKASTYCMYSK